MSRGFVYILSNPFMPDVVKIGKTTRGVEQRAHELFQTGLPAPFKIESYFETPDCDALEQLAHDQLSDFRVSMSREFFSISADDAGQAVFWLHHDQILDWVQDFMPTHVLVEQTFFIEPSTLVTCAEKCDLSPYDMDEVFCQLTAEELAPAALRHIAVRDARRERMKSAMPAWPAPDGGAVN